MLKLMHALALATILGAGAAHAAQLSVTVIINSPPSGPTLTCTQAPMSQAPIPAGTKLCDIGGIPAGWSGTVALTGAGASLFTAVQSPTGGLTIQVGPGGIPVAGNYSFVVNTTP